MHLALAARQYADALERSTDGASNRVRELAETAIAALRDLADAVVESPAPRDVCFLNPPEGFVFNERLGRYVRIH